MASSSKSNTPQSSHIVNLVSKDASKISSVSVYSGRAEITRSFTFSVAQGQNQVTITGLPRSLESESLRVEGRGAATIHDVTVSTALPPTRATTSPALESLKQTKARIAKALQRATKVLTSLEGYARTMHSQHLTTVNVSRVIDNVESIGERWDDKVLELKNQLKVVEAEIQAEEGNLNGPVQEDTTTQVSVSVFSEIEGEVALILIYAVNDASWDAVYDIRVDMQDKKMPVKVIYKANITQRTGEDWNDVSLVLETAAPTFGLNIPTLDPWTLSPYVYRPAAVPLARTQSRSIVRRKQDEDGYGQAVQYSAMMVKTTEVTSKGNISATFQIPGFISIPSDGVGHKVTISELDLEATMSWISVPKKDPKTHLKANITNSSEYTFLSGTASVYVDGSFISKSDVPQVSPGETFDCPLGLDPSIRMTYHPCIKNQKHSGFVSKTITHEYHQRITIFNTKSVAIDNFKVVDQVPISEDSQVVVKLISPSLSIPTNASSSSSSPAAAGVPPPPLQVSEGVVAQWDGVEEDGYDMDAVGKDGKLNWKCSIPAQEKINIALRWEVTAPARTQISGL